MAAFLTIQVYFQVQRLFYFYFSVNFGSLDLKKGKKKTESPDSDSLYRG